MKNDRLKMLAAGAIFSVGAFFGYIGGEVHNEIKNVDLLNKLESTKDEIEQVRFSNRLYMNTYDDLVSKLPNFYVGSYEGTDIDWMLKDMKKYYELGKKCDSDR